jgi:hypothetical protein
MSFRNDLDAAVCRASEAEDRLRKVIVKEEMRGVGKASLAAMHVRFLSCPELSMRYDKVVGLGGKCTIVVTEGSGGHRGDLGVAYCIRWFRVVVANVGLERYWSNPGGYDFGWSARKGTKISFWGAAARSLRWAVRMAQLLHRARLVKQHIDGIHSRDVQ